MSVKNKLTNRSCGLATAVSDGKDLLTRCVYLVKQVLLVAW